MAKLVSRFDRNGALTLAMSAAGIGLSVGSWSATRDASYFGNALLVPAMPVVMVFVALALAVAFKRARGKSPHARSLWVAAAVLVAAFLLAIPLVSFLSESEKFVFGILMTAVEGTASTLLVFLFLMPLVRFSSRQIAVTVASGYLLVHLYDGLFLAMPQGVCLAQRPLALLAMVGLAGVLCRHAGASGAAEKPGEASQRMDKSGAAEKPLETPPVGAGSGPSSASGASTGPMAWPRPVAECLLLGALVAVLLLVQGVYSQVTGLGSVGNVQAFNLFTELFAAGVRAAVLVYCLLRTEDVPPTHVAACAVLIFLVGIPVVDLSWGTGAYLVGSHIVNSARYVLLPLATIVGVQAARRVPREAPFLILVMIAAANSCYVSRLVAGVALDPAVGVDAVLPTVSLCSMWVVACAAPLYLLGRERLLGFAADGGCGAFGTAAGSLGAQSVRGAAGQPSQGGALGAGEAATDPALLQEIRFYRRLDDLCNKAQLTEREKEILREVLHGYSIESIAGRLGLSASTVKTYLSRAYNRFGVSSRQGVLGLLDEVEGAVQGRET